MILRPFELIEIEIAGITVKKVRVDTVVIPAKRHLMSNLGNFDFEFSRQVEKCEIVLLTTTVGSAVFGVKRIESLLVGRFN